MGADTSAVVRFNLRGFVMPQTGKLDGETHDEA